MTTYPLAVSIYTLNEFHCKQSSKSPYPIVKKNSDHCHAHSDNIEQSNWIPEHDQTRQYDRHSFSGVSHRITQRRQLGDQREGDQILQKVQQTRSANDSESMKRQSGNISICIHPYRHVIVEPKRGENDTWKLRYKRQQFDVMYMRFFENLKSVKKCSV